ncbi:hypothetical protein B0H11DRAFT_1919394 [Mycena galericulata]|nr:hypothetical protein B0H11DRAFT_1919394 [Mycena galericulata]
MQHFPSPSPARRKQHHPRLQRLLRKKCKSRWNLTPPQLSPKKAKKYGVAPASSRTLPQRYTGGRRRKETLIPKRKTGSCGRGDKTPTSRSRHRMHEHEGSKHARIVARENHIRRAQWVRASNRTKADDKSSAPVEGSSNRSHKGGEKRIAEGGGNRIA